MTIQSVRWQVLPVHPPALARLCARCNQERPFHCQQRFRINGQKRKLDVWLIYHCAYCHTTWNLEIIARAHPEALSSELLSALESNDTAVAWHYAFDKPTLRRSGAKIQYPDEYLVTGPSVRWDSIEPLVTITIESPYCFDLRLDRLLQQQLSLSRTTILRLAENGAITSPSGIEIQRHKIRETHLEVIINLVATKSTMTI